MHTLFSYYGELTVFRGRWHEPVLCHFAILSLPLPLPIAGLEEVLKVDAVVREGSRVSADCVEGNAGILQH